MYKFIDLFCGIGGFRLALEKRGLECVFSSDIDPHVQEVYKQNFGEKASGDITEIPAKKIPKHDILCAGFPCQSFSISGKHEGISDPRGRLFYEIQRIAQYHQPYVMILENVKNILTIDGGNVIKTIEQKLDEIGYMLNKHVLNASYFGIPQARERVYFVALRKDMKDSKKPNLDYSRPKESNKKVFLESILEKEVDSDFIVVRGDIKITKNENDVLNQLKPIRVGTLNKGGQGERIYSPKGHAITQSAYGGGVGARTGLYNTEQGIRRLTIDECKKAMGFPTRHKVSNGLQGYKQLGNAVVPDMIGHVYDSIRII
ncbi:DNA cytosine methyltransferase [Candidatus Liberibacter americanus]|uniref:Cytosine-specific methyltransferase n=1 Tax=Candidatus Liberibacter americanus str. Sao Paulo TaxID=1261131 RepID=U6B4I1_9HYPH|nr:DNA cytosine methyltransferase [Candidatus Liberibacter americanus]AHA27538.1 Site-specific DNA methylase [Candidatus Liberibacter americanus str. Sao Paulo]EMS36501.1 site-specific DNA methylase [Candidatus Liberibacter americanus PW_SP]